MGQHQKDVAKLLEASEASVWNWENNRSHPTLPFIPRIIEYLGYVPFDTNDQPLKGRIVNVRRMLGWTQKRLARELGVDPTTLGYWERGERRPSPRHMEKLKSLIIY